VADLPEKSEISIGRRVNATKADCTALWVHRPNDVACALKEAIARACARVHEVRSCEEAQAPLRSSQPPHLVLIDANLRDKGWIEVLTLAQSAREAVNVIVVSPEMDQKLYLDAIERGACDFVDETIAPSDLDFIVRSAASNAISRREGRKHAA